MSLSQNLASLEELKHENFATAEAYADAVDQFNASLSPGEQEELDRFYHEQTERYELSIAAGADHDEWSDVFYS